METLDIKTKLHKKIDTIENEELLLEALHLLDLEEEEGELILPIEIINKIETARNQKTSGLIIEHEEANRLVSQWLNEQ